MFFGKQFIEFTTLAMICTGINSPFDQTEHLNISANTSPMNSSDTEFQSPMSKSATEQHKDLHPKGKSWEQGYGNISYEELEYQLSNFDEEVIGIITMEDVIEELLQVSFTCTTLCSIHMLLW